MTRATFPLLILGILLALACGSPEAPETAPESTATAPTLGITPENEKNVAPADTRSPVPDPEPSPTATFTAVPTIEPTVPASTATPIPTPTLGPAPAPTATPTPEPTPFPAPRDASDLLETTLEGRLLTVRWEAVEGAAIYEILVRQYYGDGGEDPQARTHFWALVDDTIWTAEVRIRDGIESYDVLIAARATAEGPPIAVMRHEGGIDTPPDLAGVACLMQALSGTPDGDWIVTVLTGGDLEGRGLTPDQSALLGEAVRECGIETEFEFGTPAQEPTPDPTPTPTPTPEPTPTATPVPDPLIAAIEAQCPGVEVVYGHADVAAELDAGNNWPAGVTWCEDSGVPGCMQYTHHWWDDNAVRNGVPTCEGARRVVCAVTSNSELIWTVE